MPSDARFDQAIGPSVINRDGTKPIGAKVQAIHQFPIKSRGNLHIFLGMTGYYSTYCKDYAKMPFHCAIFCIVKDLLYLLVNMNLPFIEFEGYAAIGASTCTP